MADAQTKLEWTRKYERLIREMLGFGRISSTPGDVEGRNHVHEGIDVGRPFVSNRSINGAEIHAPAAATVVRTGRIRGFGNAVVLARDSHGRKVTEIFGHLQDGSIPETLVPGSSVRFGDTIGKVGATGGNYAPHLHYETHQATGDDPPQASADGVLWPQGKPPVVDPFEVQDFSDLSRYTFGIDDPRVRRVVEGYIRKKFGQRRSGEVSGTGPDFDKKVREAAVRGAANSMSVDQLAKLSDEDFSWATEGDYWRQIMDPAFRP